LLIQLKRTLDRNRNRNVRKPSIVDQVAALHRALEELNKKLDRTQAVNFLGQFVEFLVQLFQGSVFLVQFLVQLFKGSVFLVVQLFQGSKMPNLSKKKRNCPRRPRRESHSAINDCLAV
jgi:hypothetical protein